MNFIKILFLISLAPSSVLAYLDPASGSLILSSLVAVFVSIVFFFKNLFYKIISISPTSFIYGGGDRKNSKSKILNLSSFSNDCDFSLDKLPPSIVFYCEGNQYYHTFKPILDFFDSISYPYIYYTSGENDKALKRIPNNKLTILEFIGVGNKAYTKINTLKADILVLTTPGLDVLHLKKTKSVRHYCHIVHSLTPMTYRVFGVDYFDSVLVANEIQASFVAQVQKAHNLAPKYTPIVGSTYLDELSREYSKLSNASRDIKNPLDSSALNPAKKTILVSPSWGKESLLLRFGLDLLLPLAKSDFNIIIRPHPQSSLSKLESDNIATLQSTLKPYKNVVWDIGTPNIYAFQKADLMISDFSSVIFDFLCLCQKPILSVDFTFDFAGYDLADIDINDFWTFNTLEKIGGKIKKSDFCNIEKIIQNTLDSHTNKNYILNCKNSLWKYPHNAGEMAGIEILKLQKNLLEKSLGDKFPTFIKIKNLDSTLESITDSTKLTHQSQILESKDSTKSPKALKQATKDNK